MRCLSGLPSALLLALPTTFASPSNLKIETTTPASCSRPSKPGDTLSMHYIGTLASTGAEFDQSYKRGKPFTFVLGAHQVISGWDEGLKDMCPGEERRLTVPPEMAYGAFGVPPTIPGGATLIFEVKMMDIVGVEQEEVAEVATTTEGAFSIATAPPEPPIPQPEDKVVEEEETPTLQGTPLTSSAPANPTTVAEGECHLLGPFALLVQGALGTVAILSLVYKRWREEYKRPWKVWFFDVSKQVTGSMLTHALNLAMSMLGSVDMVNAAKQAAAKASDDPNSAGGGGGGRKAPNPCSFYLLNLGIDTTLGIPVLYLLLKILHAAFLFTPLAKPRESIKSGHYGQPPRASWWAKQSLIYFIGLTGMKFFVWGLFVMLPWLPWVGDWALRWTEGNEALQVAFAMFVFPLAMNAVQYWVIDNFIMDKSRAKSSTAGGEGGAYTQVRGEEDDGAGEHVLGEDDDETVETESVRGKGEEDLPPLEEVNPTPIPELDDVNEDRKKGESSRGPSPG